MKTFQFMYTKIDENIGATSEVWDGDAFIDASWVSSDLTLVVTVDDDFDNDYIETLANSLLWSADLNTKQLEDERNFIAVNKVLRTKEALYNPSAYSFIGYKEISGV